MKKNKATIVIVPGYDDSGPKHWQSIWLSQFPNSIKVVQKDWNSIDKEAWVDELEAVVHSTSGPLVLVGHSLGSLTIIEWAGKTKLLHKIKGALLVAPADPRSEAFRALKIEGFARPVHQLPFPTLLVISENDPFLSVETARDFGAILGCPCINVGKKGHLGSDSNVGEWNVGKEFLKTLLE